MSSHSNSGTKSGYDCPDNFLQTSNLNKSDRSTARVTSFADAFSAHPQLEPPQAGCSFRLLLPRLHVRDHRARAGDGDLLLRASDLGKLFGRGAGFFGVVLGDLFGDVFYA